MIELMLDPLRESGGSNPIELRDGDHLYQIEGMELFPDAQYSVSFGGKPNHEMQNLEIYKIGLDLEMNELRVDGVGLDGVCAWVVEE